MTSMNVIATAIKQPITVTVGVIFSLLAGFVALKTVPIAMTPEVEDTVIAVTTTWENASPQEVESEIIDEQEERLQNVENLRRMTSISQRGQGLIRLEFHTGTNKEHALREVSDKLREVPSYPFNVDEPVISDSDPDSRDFIAWVVLRCSDSDFDIASLYDFVDKRLKPQFERIPGMAEVGIFGGREREVQIRVDPVLLAQRGISISQFVDAIQRTNDNFSGGALADGKFDIRLRAVGRFKSVEQVLDTIVRKSSAGPVYIRDVAEVVDTYKEPTSVVRSKGEPVIAVNFQREIGSNVIQVMEYLKQEIAQMNEPGGILDNQAKTLGIDGTLKLEQSYDQTEYIHQAIDLVLNNIMLGGSLATITLLLFLRSLKSVGIIALAIPISVITSIIILVALGRTINVISLAGLAFAVGMVVDNSIVVLENIYRHLEMGKKAAKAAYDGTTEVAGAVLASTLTTLIVFIPILLIQESAGQLFRDIALAICASVGLSFIISITLIPSYSVVLHGADNHHVHHYAGEGKRAVMARFFSHFFLFLTRNAVARWLIIAVFCLGTILGIYLLMPPIDYLPLGNRNIVFGILNPPPGYNLEYLMEIGGRIEDRIRPMWELDRHLKENGKEITYSPDEVGRNPFDKRPVLMDFERQQPIVPPPINNYFLVMVEGQMFHGAISSDPERVVDLIPLFQHATAPEIAPGIIAYAFQMPVFRIAGRTGSAVQVDLLGPNLDNVRSSASQLFRRIAGEYGIYTVQSEPLNFNLLSPELQVYPEFINLSDLNLSMRDLGVAVQVYGDGAFVGDYDMDGEMVDLKVISKDSIGETSLNDFGKLPVSTPNGEIVSLESISRLYRVMEADQIKRVGRQRAVTLQFTPPLGMPLQAAIGKIDSMIDNLKQTGMILPDVETQLAGSASKLDAMQTALLGDGTIEGTITSSLFLSLLVVYLLMCVLFQSWLYPFVIMISVPLATFGGFLALALVHAWSFHNRYIPIQNLDVLTILGFIILAGVVVNNAILIVHQTLNFLREKPEANGRSELRTARQSIADAVESRVRPIFMSTFTSVGGLLPLVVMPGSGSELYRGLGSVVLGGLLVSTLFTLILVPIILNVVFNIKSRFGSIVSELEI